MLNVSTRFKDRCLKNLAIRFEINGFTGRYHPPRNKHVWRLMVRWKSELNVAKSAVCREGKALLDISGADYQVSLKSDRSPVTEADLAVIAILKESLPGSFVPVGSSSTCGTRRLFLSRNQWIHQRPWCDSLVPNVQGQGLAIKHNTDVPAHARIQKWTA